MHLAARGWGRGCWLLAAGVGVVEPATEQGRRGRGRNGKGVNEPKMEEEMEGGGIGFEMDSMKTNDWMEGRSDGKRVSLWSAIAFSPRFPYTCTYSIFSSW